MASSIVARSLSDRQVATLNAHTAGEPIVIDRQGFTLVKPKNLGWLLRHATEVSGFTVEAHNTDACQVTAWLDGLEPGAAYITTFASASVLWDWLRRPRFNGVPLRWFAYETVVGRDDHRQASEAIPAERQPVCCRCGQVGSRWFQPLIGTENFCSVACAQRFTGEHYTGGEHRPGQTCTAFAHDNDAANARHNAPESLPERAQPIRGCAHAIRPGLSFASSHEQIKAGFCPEPAIDGSDYCQAHDHLYPPEPEPEPVETRRLRERLGVEPGEALPAFAWPGGYLIEYVSRDGLSLCADCAGKADTSDPVEAFQILEGDYEIDYGMPPVPVCEDCNRPLDPADRGESQS